MTNEELKENINLLSKCPLFTGLSRSDIAALDITAEGKVMNFGKGKQLDSCNMYIILSGNVAIEKIASDGRHIQMAVASSPAAINAASALNSNLNLSQLTAQSDCKVISITSSALQKTIINSGMFSINFTRFLTDRICFLNKKMELLTGYSAESKINRYLMENAVNGSVVISSSLTSLAKTLGIGRASLYRALDKMEEEQLITRNGKTISLL